MPSVLQAASANSGSGGAGDYPPPRASVDVSLLPVVEACVVAAVRGRVGEVRVAADELRACDRPEASQERHYSSCGMEPFPCLRPMARGILGGVPPRPNSPPVDSGTTPHIEERGPSAWHRRTQPFEGY